MLFPRNYNDTIFFTLLFVSRNWIDFFFGLIVSISLGFFCLHFWCSSCGRRGLQSASLGRSIFIFLVFADLAGSGLARPPSNCSNPFESTEMLVLFFLAVDFSTLNTHCRTFPPARALSGSVFLPTKLSPTLARAARSALSVDPSCAGSRYSSVVGCSGAVQVSGRFIGRRAAAFRRAVSREWSSVKWTEPFEPANTRTRTTRRGHPERSPAMDVVVVGALFSSNDTLSTQTHSHQTIAVGVRAR